MQKLIQEIKKIPKEYFSLNDIRKIFHLKEGGLSVAVNRLVKSGEIIRLAQGIYSINPAKVNWEQLAIESYYPSYLSFEWVLAKYNILSQKPMHLTLATAKRSNRIKTIQYDFIYHHLKKDLFWGYEQKDGVLIANKEKAFLDLAYLSLNGYAKFDVDEMNLKLLDRGLLKRYLKRFGSERLNRLMDEYKLLVL